MIMIKAKPLSADGCTEQRVRVLYPFDMDGNSGKCTLWASIGLSCCCIRIALGKGGVARAQLDVPMGRPRIKTDKHARFGTVEGTGDSCFV